MMNIIHILNSDFWVWNTIGVRAKYIADILAKKNYINYIVYCRWYKKDLKQKFDIRQVFFASDFIMKILTAISIYTQNKINTNFLKTYIFEKALKNKFKNLNFDKITIIHSWDYLPSFYKFVKNKNSHIKIIQDVPMAFSNMLSYVRDYRNLFNITNLNLPEYIKDSLSYVDYFIVPSDFVRQSLIREWISENKIFIVPFWVDINKFKPREKDFNWTFKVAFSGNVNNRKGILYLIQAWKELNLKNAELNIYWRIYPEVRKYFKDAEKYNIKLHWFVEDISNELAKNHIYVFPSLLEWSAKSVYEALACGLPVITTKHSWSIVENWKDWFIIPIQDIDSIKDKIWYFYINREKIKGFSYNARKKAEFYTWDRYWQTIYNIYSQII